MGDADTRKVVRISSDSEALVQSYAKKRGIGVGEAADQLIATGQSRLNALARYAKNKDPKPAGKPRAKKSAKSKSKSNGAAAHA